MLAVTAPPGPALAWRYTPPPLPKESRRIGAPTLLPSVERDIASALDPVRLSRHVGIAPDPWQAELLRCPDRQMLVNCSRQVGKSTTTATLASHTAIYDPGAPILLLSPSLRQSGQLFQKVKWTLKRLGSEFAPTVTDNALSVRLANGSEIHSLPGKAGTVRGFSAVKLVIVDEAAFVADDLYAAVSPMLAVSGGRLILLSTPFGKRGFFWEQWDEATRAGRAGGRPDWRLVSVTAEQCPRIPPEFLASERRKLGPLFQQEYGCVFLDVVMAAFRGEDIAAALDNDLEPLFGLEVA
jgi:hypothetical protein